MIDLHTHSRASDGALTPSQLVEMAVRIGLSALALTDHDTVAGIGEAEACAKNNKLTFIPGIEFSSHFEQGTLHIVGLFVDCGNAELSRSVAQLVEMRNERNLRIAKRLSAIGMPIEMSEVTAMAGGGVVGRPHFAELMVKKGYVKRFRSAFKKYLERGQAAYEPRRKLSARRTIEIIRGAGGVAILAHPDQTQRKGDDLDTLVKDLAQIGLQGIEAYCTNYATGHIHRYIRLAKKYGLILSGGSDFHGALKAGITLGKGSGSLRVPDELLGPIIRQAEANRSCNGRERVGIEPT